MLTLFVICPLFLSCGRRGDFRTLEALVSSNDPVFKGKPVSTETTRLIRDLLDSYEKDIDEQVSRSEELGVLYKNIALKYLDIDRLRQSIDQKIRQVQEKPEPPASDALGLYHEALAVGSMNRRIFREALINFEKAIEYFPENDLLYYYCGVCAATIGKSLVRLEQREERSTWYKNAEAFYRQAISLNPNYPSALYGLSILLVYELDRPAEAETLIRRVTEIEKKNIDALFLLANVYYRIGELQKAVEQYEKIGRITKLKDKMEQAKSNKNRVLEELYEPK